MVLFTDLRDTGCLEEDQMYFIKGVWERDGREMLISLGMLGMFTFQNINEMPRKHLVIAYRYSRRELGFGSFPYFR